MTKHEMILPPDEIALARRYRKEYEKDDKDAGGEVHKMHDLVGSLNEFGQLQNVGVISKKTAGSFSEKFFYEIEEDREYVVIYGGRRVKAINRTDCTLEGVRCTEYRDITEQDFRAMELEENIRRKNLNWRERTALLSEIHELGVEQHGEYIPTGKGDKKSGYSTSDTAKKAGMKTSNVTRYLKVGKMMDANPNMFKDAANMSEVEKIANKMARQQERKVRTTIIETRREKTPKQQLLNELAEKFMVGDAVAEIKKLEDGCVDGVECDPPYGIMLNELKKGDTDEYIEYIEWDHSLYLSNIIEILRESHRIIKHTGWLLLWYASDPWGQILPGLIRQAGKPTECGVREWINGPLSFKFREIPLMWFRAGSDRKGSGQTNRPDRYLGHVYDTCYYIRKGHVELNMPGRADVYNIAPLRPKSKEHKTERPIQLYESVLQTFFPPGSRVCSPCLGAGRNILAANNKHIDLFGWDLSQHNRNRFVSDFLENLGEPGAWKDK